MILHYPNYESACLAVTKLRDEGHYAEVCDMACSGLWGPAAIGGVRVIASDEPIMEAPSTEEDQPVSESTAEPEPKPAGAAEELFNILRGMVFALCLLVPLAMLVALLSFFINRPVAFVITLLGLAGFLLLMTVMAMVLPRVMRRFVFPDDTDRRPIVVTILLVMLALLLGLILV